MVSTGCSSSRSSSSSWRSKTNIGPNAPAALQRHDLLTHRSKLQASQDRDQQAAPLLDAVLARGNKLETPLHVPGHKVCVYAGVCRVAFCLGPHCVQHQALPALVLQKSRLQHTVRLAPDHCRHVVTWQTLPLGSFLVVLHCDDLLQHTC